jgi:hypothetical protein
MTLARPRETTWLWIAAATAAALLLAAASLGARGAGRGGTDLGLFSTGRLAFLLFLPAYAGGAMATLFGAAFQPVRRRGRVLGLAFAAVLVVHLTFVAWLCVIGAPPALATFVQFGIAVGFIVPITLLSIGRLQGVLGPRAGWLLRAVGLNYVAYVFAADFLNHPLHGGIVHVATYLPFAVLSLLGPAIWVAGQMARLIRGPAADAGAGYSRPYVSSRRTISSSPR